MDRPASARVSCSLTRLATLLAVFGTALVTVAFAPSAAFAAPTLITQASHLTQVDVDGANIYWSNGHAVTRVDVATGLGSVVYRAPAKSLIGDLDARDGRVAIITLKGSKKALQSKALVYTLGASAQVLATASVKIKKKFPACGSTLTLGRTGAGGEVLVIKDKLSLGKKLCHSTPTFSSTVTGYGSGGSRLLFNGDFFPGSPLLKLGDIYNADIQGSKLMLAGEGVGVYDITSQQFVLVAPASRNAAVSGAFDGAGNVLVGKYNFKQHSGAYQLFDAVSGFSNPIALGGGNGGFFFESCGKYLIRAQYAVSRHSQNGVAIVANPLIADSPVANDLFPLVPNSQTYLDDASCDGANVVYAVDSSTSPNSQVIYLAPSA